MTSPTRIGPQSARLVATLSLLAAWAGAAQGPSAGEVPAPASPPPSAGAPAQAADEPRERPAETLDAAAIGPVVIEDMAAVLRREAEQGPIGRPDPADRAGAQGEWEVPGMRWSRRPHSGAKLVINRWGDTRMGIGFGGEVDLLGAWVAGQGTRGSWADGLQAIGYRYGEEVARTGWFEAIGATPAWFAMDLEGIDRVELVARPVIQGSGWYALDDLCFEIPGEDGSEERVVLDFEDVDFGTRLTGSGYAGLTWEIGRGDFVQPAREMPPPQVPPGVDLESEDEGAPPGPAKLGVGGTTPRLLQDFDGPRFGDAGCCWLPPDTCGSVGPAHFVAVTNVNLSVFDKTTGQRMLSVSLATFFNEAVGDPRVAYDPHHDRWAILAMTGPTPTGRVHFAYSLGGDPTGAWLKAYIDTAQGPDAGSWPDYPTLGLDVDGIYTASLMVGANTISIFSIDKAPLLAATPSMGTVSAWRGLPWEGAVQPCLTYGDSGGVYLVSRRSSTTLRLRQIVGPLTAPTLVSAGNPAVPSHSSPPDAPQLGTPATLDSLDFRPMNAVYRDGSVWTAHSVSVDGRAAVRWYEIDVATATALQVGTVSDPSLYFYIPSISVNASHDMVLGFSGSDAGSYAGAWLTGRRAQDPPGATGPPLLYEPGLGPYTQLTAAGVNRWGDYSLTSVDPLDDETFWTIQEYAPPNNAWLTRIAEVDFSCTASTYCTPKITSKLCAATMTWTGTPTLQQPQGFQIRCEGMDTAVSAIVFFGLDGPAAKPFQGGTLCVASPLWRLPGQSTGGAGGACNGALVYTLADLMAAPGGAQLANGSQVCCQAWARDSGDPYGTSLSDALSFEVCQ